MDRVIMELFGQDPRVKKTIVYAQNIAVSKAPVLIVGERGVGKKTLAQFIHENSGRSERAFMVVDCLQSSPSAEELLLGHRDKATDRFHRGAFELANGGTVVLANIDALDESFQKRLFQIISELNDYNLDIRLIATTTKNLAKLVAANRFSRLLFTYFGAGQMLIPPFRERPNDLEALAKFFVRKYGKRNIELTDLAMRKIVNHPWTVNAEELARVMEVSLMDQQGDILDDTGIIIGEKKNVLEYSDDGNEGLSLMSLRDAERLLIKKALMHTSENRTQAAKILGVSIRTLRNKINEYRIEGSSYFMNLR